MAARDDFSRSQEISNWLSQFLENFRHFENSSFLYFFLKDNRKTFPKSVYLSEMISPPF
jgi:hypothetical protein